MGIAGEWADAELAVAIVVHVHYLPAPTFAMDRLESLGSALSQITLYDIKSMVNQVCRQGVIAKVWECSSRVGQECRVQCQRNGSEGAGRHQRRALVGEICTRRECGT